MSTHRIIVPRPYYQKLFESYRDTEQVKILQGIRRCGKSTIMEQCRDSLINSGVQLENIYYRRFDSLDMPLTFTADNLLSEIVQAYSESEKDSMFYVFLDGIQEVDGWEKIVRKLHTERNIDVYITGSNAHLLSSDLATLLSGRCIVFDVFPLSFIEYADFVYAYDSTSNSSREELFAQYMRYGGMPSLFSLAERAEDFIARELSSLIDTVLLNDVARHLDIRDIALLKRLVVYLFSTSGNLFSTRKVVGALVSSGKKTSSETVNGYINALEDAFALYGIEQAGIAGKQIINPLRKFYPVDTGLRNLSTRFSLENSGFMLENIVCIELLRRGYHVNVGSTGRAEVDFVATKGDSRVYIQVTQTMLDQAVYERELAPLQVINDSFPKLVLTLDWFAVGVTQEGIRIENVIDWLSEKE